jgi:hypothetical protein
MLLVSQLGTYVCETHLPSLFVSSYYKDLLTKLAFQTNSHTNARKSHKEKRLLKCDLNLFSKPTVS